MLRIRHEQPSDHEAVEALLDRAFGIRRRLKISYRYRIGLEPVRGLCLVAEGGTGLVGAIRYWPVRLGERPALLLGPLAIEPALRGRGIGATLIETSLARAAATGHGPVFLVGDPAYYARFGFRPAPSGTVMPGEDPARLMLRRLDDATEPLSGVLLRADTPAAAPRPAAAHPPVGDRSAAVPPALPRSAPERTKEVRP